MARIRIDPDLCDNTAACLGGLPRRRVRGIQGPGARGCRLPVHRVLDLRRQLPRRRRVARLMPADLGVARPRDGSCRPARVPRRALPPAASAGSTESPLRPSTTRRLPSAPCSTPSRPTISATPSLSCAAGLSQDQLNFVWRGQSARVARRRRPGRPRRRPGHRPGQRPVAPGHLRRRTNGVRRA